MDHLGSGYETQLRTGFENSCARYNCNLVFVVGRPLFSPDPLSVVHNRVYGLVRPGSMDGVIFVSAGLASACGADRLKELCESYRPMALCSIGIELPDVPSIVIDNQLGMEAVIEHVIRDHGRRRVAFVGGPPKNADAIARMQVYRKVLERHGIEYSPNLTAFGDFTYSTGLVATNTLLERGAQFDALVAANDGMALGAIDSLKRSGSRVPGDICVAGFDDLVSARFSNPPLTTARQPLERMAALALDTIVAQLDGNLVPIRVCLPVELVKRRSCGCHFRNAVGTESRAVDSPSLTEFLGKNSERLREHLDELLLEPGGQAAGGSSQILDALQAEIDGSKGTFLSALELFLEKSGGHNEYFDDVQTAISFLRHEFGAIKEVDLEDLWDAARRAIALSNTRSQSEQRSNIEVTYQRLLRCGEMFASVPDLATLERTLAEELPLIPINNVLIALCVEGESTELEPFFALCDGRVIELPKTSQPAAKLLSLAESYTKRRHTLFALPLTFESHYLGVAIFEPQSGLGVCGMLREQISFALKSVSLHQEIVHKTALHERSVQERVAAMTRMESLSVMAGGVAHDLNSALSPLVALPDTMLGLIEKLGVAHSDEGRRLRNYVETIKSAANRATQTIRDLMTLGRQGRMQKAPLDLNWIVAGCLSAEPQLIAKDEQNSLEVTIELSPLSLLVNASQYHVERAISNLVRNAIEAIGEAGTLSVYTGAVNVIEPILGHETVVPGKYAVVAVSDTGPGIPANMIARVFEPFFTNKKLRDSSGSGLGLSIVHGVVKEHEGFVNVASEKGHGTTFTLYFPLADQSFHFASENDSGAALEDATPSEVFGIDTREPPSAVHGRVETASNTPNPLVTMRPTKLGS